MKIRDIMAISTVVEKEHPGYDVHERREQQLVMPF